MICASPPAVAGDQAAYLVLYRALAIYDVSANLQATNSQESSGGKSSPDTFIGAKKKPNSRSERSYRSFSLPADAPNRSLSLPPIAPLLLLIAPSASRIAPFCSFSHPIEYCRQQVIFREFSLGVPTRDPRFRLRNCALLG